MLNRPWIAIVLSASIGGTATTAAPGAPLSAPLGPRISTPDIALPGSGNAVGATLSSVAGNDSRWSSAPSVWWSQWISSCRGHELFRHRYSVHTLNYFGRRRTAIVDLVIRSWDPTLRVGFVQVPQSDAKP